ncbi:peptide-binding protein [Desmospora profundinema]|uniref:Peptide/nickel transport system substrate-binding protein n=1 Tax=Desmospora profundinema TaxID=1571184 RepID=A0ABU1IR13_9BACL|nr:peptide-binding protein [Desmospora profundinema]MDR6226599.1 peptide/nickel transport system substrate-binding protein [Desmospora profundinema]
MKKKSLLITMSLVLVLSVFLAACGGQQADDGKGDDGEPVKGGTVTLSMFSAPKGLFNPVLYEDQYDVYVINKAFDGLWTYNEDLEIEVPLLAKEWKLSEDGQELTITLRDDIKWHDGEDITTDDLIFTWEAIAKKDYSGSRFYMVEPIEGADEMKEGKADSLSGVEKVDDQTVKVKFKERAANVLSNLWSIPIPEHIFGDMNNEKMLNADATKKEPIGSGPFKITEIKPNEYVVMERNEDYYRGEVYLDKVIWKVIEQEVAIGALQNGEIDALAQIAPTEFDALKKDKNLVVEEDQDFAYQYMGFNLKKKKLQDKTLRQAITYGINRQAIVDGLLKGHGDVLNQHIPQKSWAYNEDLEDAYPHNPDKAKKLLKDAGYKDTNGDGFLEDPDGKKLELTLSYPTGNPVREKSAPIIAEDLKKIGLNVKLDRPAETGVYFDNIEKGKYEMFLAGWSLTPDPDPSGIWMSTDKWNFANWKNKKSDELIKKGVFSKDALDQDKRAEIYKEWTEVVSEDAPYVFLYSQNWIEAWNSRVKGVKFRYDGGIEHHDAHEWWIPENLQ